MWYVCGSPWNSSIHTYVFSCIQLLPLHNLMSYPQWSNCCNITYTYIYTYVYCVHLVVDGNGNNNYPLSSSDAVLQASCVSTRHTDASTTWSGLPFRLVIPICIEHSIPIDHEHLLSHDAMNYGWPLSICLAD